MLLHHKVNLCGYGKVLVTIDFGDKYQFETTEGNLITLSKGKFYKIMK